MIRKLFIVLAATFICATAISQTPENNLISWSETNPIEKLYLHVDRESYTAGQTIWFKAYFVSDYIPSVKSTAMYVELLNSEGQILQRKVFPAYKSESMGQVDLPENIISGSYILRAYSPLMLNQPGFVFNKKIAVFGKEPLKSKKTPLPARTEISFFPEGGNLIKGLMNNLAFKAVDENGIPVDVTIDIKNSRNELVTTVSSTHDGMGVFALVPLPGDNYYAVIANKSDSEKYPLPASTERGVTLTVRNAGNEKFFKIEQISGNEPFKAAYMVGQMQNSPVFKVSFKGDKDILSGTIQTRELLSGILHITVFNKDGMPLAERLTFVNNKEYLLPASLIVDTLNTGERKKNHYSIALKDTVFGHFSVAVTDADYELSERRPQNILSYFLLTSDIKGYVHNPAWYFSNADKAAGNIELVMMTNGWTRFKWEDAVRNTLPPPVYKDPFYISLKGKVTIEGTKRPFANKDLIYFMSPVDTSLRRIGLPRFIKTDSSGGFRIDTMIFYDKTNILFSDIKGNKSRFIKVRLDGDSLYRNYNIPSIKIPFKDSLSEEATAKMTDAYKDYLREEGLMLANVTVRGRVKSQQELLEEKYTSGLFSGGINSRTLDLTNEPGGAMNIFEYLQGRMPGLRVDRNSQGGYSLSYRDGGMGGGNVTLYLDEVQTEATFIESIPVNEVAFVKLMGNFVGTFGGGAALAIYLKKGAELSAVTESATDIVRYNGYSIIKEFYNPDYRERKPDDSKADSRLTLYWMPSVYVANVDGKIPVNFYNNDRTKKFKIVAEGITNDGRFMMLEQIVNP